MVAELATACQGGLGNGLAGRAPTAPPADPLEGGCRIAHAGRIYFPPSPTVPPSPGVPRMVPVHRRQFLGSALAAGAGVALSAAPAAAIEPFKRSGKSHLRL